MVNKIKINNKDYYSVDELNIKNFSDNEIIYAKKINNQWIMMNKKRGCKKFIQAKDEYNTILNENIIQTNSNNIKIKIIGTRNKNNLYFNLSDVLSNYCNKILNQTLVKTEYGISNLFITNYNDYYINYQDLLKILVIHPYYLIPITNWIDEICSSFKIPKMSGIYLTSTLTLDITENLQDITNTQILYFVPISSINLYLAKVELEKITTSDLTIICSKMDEIKNKFENELNKKIAYLDKKIVQQELDFTKRIKQLELENIKLQFEMIKQRLNIKL